MPTLGDTLLFVLKLESREMASGALLSEPLPTVDTAAFGVAVIGVSFMTPAPTCTQKLDINNTKITRKHFDVVFSDSKQYLRTLKSILGTTIT